MKLTEMDGRIILEALQIIDPHFIFTRQIKAKIIELIKADENKEQGE